MEPMKKPKSSRNTDKRRERSKVAARCRRGKESDLFSQLSSCLPIPSSAVGGLDKASIVRLALCDLKLKSMLDKTSPSFNPLSLHGAHDNLLNDAMNGFIIVISGDGDIVYVSDRIASNLGLSQYEVMGQNIYELCHPCDVGDVKELLSASKGESEHLYRNGFFRMKCTLTSRGRSVHLRSASHKVLNCSGRLFSQDENEQSPRWFVGLAEPLLHPSDVDIPLDKQTFLTKHTPDMKFEYVDETIQNVLGYQPSEIIGKSVFDFYHAADGFELSRSFKSLFAKGQIETQRHRFLAKNGGWVWLVTQATVLYGQNGTKPKAVVCLHFVTSEREHCNEIISNVQCESSLQLPLVYENKSIDQENIEPVDIIKLDEEGVDSMDDFMSGSILSKATPSTFKIFAPKTEDMNTGFFIPMCDGIGVTKEVPEDLAYLAPIAGDECVALDVPLLDDLLESLGQTGVDYDFDGKIVDIDSAEMPLITVTSGKDTQEKSTIDLSLLEQSGKTCPTVIPAEKFMRPITLTEDPKSYMVPMKNIGGGNVSICPTSIFCTEIEYDNGSPVVVPPKLSPGYAMSGSIGQKMGFVTNVDSGTDSPADDYGSPVSVDSDLDPMKTPVCLSEVFPALVPSHLPSGPPPSKMEFTKVCEPIIIKHKNPLHSTALQSNLGGYNSIAKFSLPGNFLKSQKQEFGYVTQDSNQSGGVPFCGSFTKEQNIREVNLDRPVVNGGLGTGKNSEPPPTKMQKFSEDTRNPQIVAKEVAKPCKGEPPKLGVEDLGKDSEKIDMNSPLEEIPPEARVLFMAFLKKMGLKVVKDDNVVEKKSVDTDSYLRDVEECTKSRKRDVTGELMGNQVNKIFSRPMSFMELTRQDCEVNAPVQESGMLLQGTDLLKALDDLM